MTEAEFKSTGGRTRGPRSEGWEGFSQRVDAFYEKIESKRKDSEWRDLLELYRESLPPANSSLRYHLQALIKAAGAEDWFTAPETEADLERLTGHADRVVEGFIWLYRSIAKAIEYHFGLHETPACEPAGVRWPIDLPFVRIEQPSGLWVCEQEVQTIAAGAAGRDELGAWHHVLQLLRLATAPSARQLRNAESHALNGVTDPVERLACLVQILAPWKFLRLAYRHFPHERCGTGLSLSPGQEDSASVYPGGAVDVCGWFGFLLWADVEGSRARLSQTWTDELRELAKSPPERWDDLMPLFPAIVSVGCLEVHPKDARARALAMAGAPGIVQSLKVSRLQVSFAAWTKDDVSLAEKNWLKRGLQAAETLPRTFVWLDTRAAANGVQEHTHWREPEIRLHEEPSRGDPDRCATGTLTYLDCAGGPAMHGDVAHLRVGGPYQVSIADSCAPSDQDAWVEDSADTPARRGEARIASALPLVVQGRRVWFSNTLQHRLAEDLGQVGDDPGPAHPSQITSRAAQRWRAGLSGALYLVDVPEGTTWAVGMPKVAALASPQVHLSPWLPSVFGRGTWKLKGGKADYAVLLHHAVPVHGRAPNSVLEQLEKRLVSGALGRLRVHGAGGSPLDDPLIRLVWSLWTSVTTARALKLFPEVASEGRRGGISGHGRLTPAELLLVSKLSNVLVSDFRYAVWGNKATSDGQASAARYRGVIDGVKGASEAQRDWVAFTLLAFDLVRFALGPEVLARRGSDNEVEASGGSAGDRDGRDLAWQDTPPTLDEAERLLSWASADGGLESLIGPPSSVETSARWPEANGAVRALADDLATRMMKLLVPGAEKPRKTGEALPKRVESAFIAVLSVLEARCIGELEAVAAAPQRSRPSTPYLDMLLWFPELPSPLDPTVPAAGGEACGPGPPPPSGDMGLAWQKIAAKLELDPAGAGWRDGSLPAQAGRSWGQDAAFLRAVAGAFSQSFGTERRCGGDKEREAALQGQCTFSLGLRCACTSVLHASIQRILSKRGESRGPTEAPADPHALRILLHLARMTAQQRALRTVHVDAGNRG